MVEYRIPAMPLVTGGVADTLAWLEEPMNASRNQLVPASDATANQVQLGIRGLLFGETDIVARLDRVGDSFVFR